MDFSLSSGAFALSLLHLFLSSPKTRGFERKFVCAKDECERNDWPSTEFEVASVRYIQGSDLHYMNPLPFRVGSRLLGKKKAPRDTRNPIVWCGNVFPPFHVHSSIPILIVHRVRHIHRVSYLVREVRTPLITATTLFAPRIPLAISTRNRRNGGEIQTRDLLTRRIICCLAPPNARGRIRLGHTYWRP